MKVTILRSGIFKNASALYLVQIANYIIPLLTLPFLTRTLGKLGYGELVSLQAIVAYGMVVTDYGFQLSGTRKIAKLHEMGADISDTYVQITATRMLLAVVSIILMYIGVIFLPYVELNFQLASAMAILVLSNALTPLWLFQGIQRMGYISIILLSSRLIVASLTFLFVRTVHDVGIALWMQAIGVGLPACFALWQVNRLISVSSKPSIHKIRYEIIDGWPIFQTAIFSSLLTNSGVLILGSLAGPNIAGGYAAVERIAKGIASMLSPITQAIYPKVSSSFARSLSEGTIIVKRFGVPLVLLSLALAFLTVILRYTGAIGYLLGYEYQAFASCLVVFAPWMVFGVINNVLGIQYLTNIGQQRWYATSFSIATIVSIILFFVLGKTLSYWGIAVALVVGEIILTSFLLLRVYKVKKRYGGSIL